jgi:hypothetical protein
MSNYSWNVSKSGDWSNAADWLGGVPNDASAIVTIAHTGTYTVSIASNESYAVGSVTLNATKATLEIDGTLSLGGTLNLTAGSLYLDGTIKGGTINAGSRGGG